MVVGLDAGNVPRRIDGGDAASLDPMMRFVLDQVDGVADVGAISDSTMLDPGQVDAILRTLASRGLVAYGSNARSDAASPSSASEGAASARIDAVFAALSQATHYEILGIPKSAEKALLKRAYFVLSKEFHPDSSSAKRVAGARPKLEAIFRKLTEAHDVLTRPKRREAYDAELENARRDPFATKLHPPIEMPQGGSEEPDIDSRGRDAGSPAERMLEVTTPTPRPSDRLERPGAGAASPAPFATDAGTTPRSSARAATIPAGPSSVRIPIVTPAPSVRAASVPPSTHGAPPRSVGSAPSGARPPVAPPTSSHDAARPSVSAPRPAAPASSSVPPSPSTPTDPAARRSIETAQRLARDIARQTGHTPQPSSAPPRPESPTSADSQRSLLRAIHGASQATGPTDKAREYERQASVAEAAGDLRTALTYLRAAAQFDTSRADLRERLDATDRKIAASEADELRLRAAADERAGRSDAAANAWMRVCLGRPGDVDAHANAARCLLEAGTDLRKARDLAQKAVDLDPKRVSSRILLVRVFKAAGMRLNAVRELEAAAKLDPENQLVKNLQRELK